MDLKYWNKNFQKELAQHRAVLQIDTEVSDDFVAYTFRF